MFDTSLDMEKYIRDKYMQMDAEQRFLIGIRMFDTARTIALSSFPEGISTREERRLLCERFYKTLAPEVFPKSG